MSNVTLRLQINKKSKNVVTVCFAGVFFSISIWLFNVMDFISFNFAISGGFFFNNSGRCCSAKVNITGHKTSFVVSLTRVVEASESCWSMWKSGIKFEF